MSNLVSVFDSMVSDFLPRVHRRPWIVDDQCGSIASFPQLRTSEDKYTLELDIPGVEKDDLVTELERDILTIYTKSDNAENDSDVLENKRSYRFQFKIPNDVDATQLKATLKNGVLSVTLPKSEEKKPIKMPVMIE